ncbi:hypothetical protein EV643_103363 [Kribbella sp. VKM Ac-2527]|uniref:Uncharacterized protein n=1 Tax=Kribbella caucasensis TaxID=2512215 RepID=A0A4R6KJY0_9ACTN|nr:hypothetical protein [Kribbella sp. VKM Ac-2527]TDO51624.1 hypothetical protein EV643_103363 [Kribbella sp. VKM Ac-2527]
MAREPIAWTSRRRLLHRVRTAAWPVSLVVCFGALGLIWALPGMRRRSERKAARCTICRRHRGRARLFIGGFVILQALGAATAAYTAAAPPLLCHAHVYPDGRVESEPRLQDVSPPRTWGIARDIANASTTGLALLASKTAGMRECDGPPLTVTFWQPPRVSGGGSTVGDIFVAWMPAGEEGSSFLRGAQGFGLAAEGRGLLATEGQQYVRYGPNISSTRGNEMELARHESRHTDQWAIMTLIGGPLAFPAAYYADGAFFPFSRNHFERAASLSDGGYTAPPDNLPAPLPGAAAAVGVVLLLVLRRRIRWFSRILAAGRTGAIAHQPGRCPLHTTGWFHHPEQHRFASGEAPRGGPGLSFRDGAGP